MTADALKKYTPYVFIALLGGYILFTKYPHFVPTSFGGSEHSPMEEHARAYAQNAGRAIFNSCGNSSTPNIRFLGVKEQNNGRLKIHLQVSWAGMANNYLIKGWVTCDADGTNPTWTREDKKGILMPGCDGPMPESLE